MRRDKTLLKIMLKNVDAVKESREGLCDLNYHLYLNDTFTYEERRRINEVLGKYLPRGIAHYSWKPSSVPPRKGFLEKLIKELEK